MTENEKPEAPTAPDAPTAEQPIASTPPSAEAAKPAEPQPAREQPARGGKDKGPKKPIGMPRRRMLDPVPSLEETQRFSSGPKIRELDDEIAAELEAAMSGFSGQEDLLTPDKKPGQTQPNALTGQRKQATVLSIRGGDIFVDIPGGRSQGVISALQFPEGLPKPGTVIDIDIEGYDAANGLVICTRKGAAVIADWSTVEVGQVVEARVLETNKGGLAVDVNGIRGFMPISQIDLYRVEQTEQYVNQRLKCIIAEVSPEERNLVVSRRTLLEKEREEQKEKTWAELAEGQIRDGIIRSVRDFGAFVDIGGVDGLLHISEMSWQRVNDPTKIVQPGQTVKVQVLKIDRETRKISLGLKQLQASPWDTVGQNYHSGQVINGTVTRTMDFGAFVELEPGLEGLIHVSELARQKVWRVTDFVKPGEQVSVKILSIDRDQRRISLSLKETLPDETPKAEEEEEEELPPMKPVRSSNVPLRGGTSSQQWIPMPGGDEKE